MSLWSSLWVAVRAYFFAWNKRREAGSPIIASLRIARVRRLMRLRELAFGATFLGMTHVTFVPRGEGATETEKREPCSRKTPRICGNSFLVSLTFLGIRPTTWRGPCGGGAESRRDLRHSSCASRTRGFGRACASSVDTFVSSRDYNANPGKFNAEALRACSAKFHRHLAKNLSTSCEQLEMVPKKKRPVDNSV